MTPLPSIQDKKHQKNIPKSNKEGVRDDGQSLKPALQPSTGTETTPTTPTTNLLHPDAARITSMMRIIGKVLQNDMMQTSLPNGDDVNPEANTTDRCPIYHVGDEKMMARPVPRVSAIDLSRYKSCILVNRDRFTYAKDSRGRTTFALGLIVPNAEFGGKNPNENRNFRKHLNLSSHLETGHIFAASLGGSPTAMNYFPQNKRLNRGVMRRVEIQVERQAKEEEAKTQAKVAKAAQEELKAATEAKEEEEEKEEVKDNGSPVIMFLEFSYPDDKTFVPHEVQMGYCTRTLAKVYRFANRDCDDKETYPPGQSIHRFEIERPNLCQFLRSCIQTRE